MRCGCAAGHSSRTRLLGSQPLPIILTLRQGSGDGRHWKVRQEKSGQGRFKGQEASLFIMSRPTTRPGSTYLELPYMAAHADAEEPNKQAINPRKSKASKYLVLSCPVLTPVP